MNIEELKSNIENKTLSNDFLVLVADKNSDFLASQYINEIAKYKKLTKKIIDDLSNFVGFSHDIFYEFALPTELFIYFTDKLESVDSDLLNVKNLIVVTKKISQEALDVCLDRTVVLPELNEVCIKDFMQTNAKGLNQDSIDWLYQMCEGDIYRINSEISKLSTIPESKQQALFSTMRDNNAYSDLTDLNIFNLTNSIQKHNLSEVANILQHINAIDVDAFALCTILHNAFKNILCIQCGRNVTAKDLGIKDNQFRALTYSCNKYTMTQLVHNIEYINSLDYLLKTGKIEVDEMIDLLLIHIL